MGVTEPHQDDLEFCTECCDFVESLNEHTGWCNSCSERLGYVAPSCPSCGNPTISGKLCSHCKYVKWLDQNADAIERVMATEGIRIRAAIRIVRVSNRPICQSCGQPIKGGQRGRHHFCTKNPECVKGHNVFEYHLRTKSREEALELAITAARIFKLTTAIQKPRSL